MHLDDPDMQAFLEAQLEPGERVLWVGRAGHRGALRKAMGSVRFPFAAGVILGVLWIAVLVPITNGLLPGLAAGWLAGLLGICTLGFLDPWRCERRRFYVLSSRRALSLSLHDAPLVLSAEAAPLNTRVREAHGGSGDIRFGVGSDAEQKGAAGEVIFYGIPDVRAVEALVIEARAAAAGDTPDAVDAPGASARAWELARRLRSGQAGWRSVAGRALLRMGPVAAEPLRHALQDTDAAVRAAAAEALGRVVSDHPPDPEAVGALANALADRSDSVRAAAREALHHAGGAIVLPLIRAKGEPGGWRSGALAALSIAGDKVFAEAVLRALAGGDWSVAECLGRDLTQDEALASRLVRAWKEMAPANMDALLRIVADGPRTVALPAAEAIGACGDPRVHQRLRPLLDSNPPRGRLAASVALGFLGDPVGLPFLTGALRSNRLWIRCSVARALGQLGADAAPALPELRKALAQEEDLAARRTLQEEMRRIRAAMRTAPTELLAASAPAGRGTELEPTSAPVGRGTELMQDEGQPEAGGPAGPAGTERIRG